MMRCPNCDRNSVDLLSESKVTGTTYGCPRCHIQFLVDVEPYEVVDESEIKATWEAQAEMLKESG